jgi:hypothetical protein
MTWYEWLFVAVWILFLVLMGAAFVSQHGLHWSDDSDYTSDGSNY